MALMVKHTKGTFGVGDRVKVLQKIKEGEKTRTQVFEGLVIGIKGRENNKMFTVRRIGAQQVAIERIFPLESPSVEKIQIVRKGMRGVRRAKLFYTRNKSKREIEKIYSRSVKREKAKSAKKMKKVSPGKSKKAKGLSNKSSKK